MADRILQLKLISDVTSINKGIGEVNTKLGAMTSALRGVAAGFVAAFAVSSIIDFGSEAVEMASSIEESTAKLQTLLGAHADIALAFAEDAVALGLSKEAALEAQGTFAGLMRTIGLGEAEAAAQSKAFVQLAIDMAAFSNTSVDEALVAIGAGLRGESEPLRRFSVILDDATLKAAALEQGLYDGIGPLTAQERAMAAMAVIMAQTAIQQGNFAATSDQFAGSQKQLGAELANVQSAIGMALLPIMTTLARALLDDVLPALKTFVETVGPPLRELGETVGPKVASAFDAMSTAWAALQPHLQNALTFIQPLIDILSTAMEGGLGFVLHSVEGVMNTFSALLKGDFSGAFDAVGTTVGNLATDIDTFFMGLPGKLIGWAGEIGTAALDIGSAIFNGIVNGLVGIAAAITAPVRDGLNEILKMWNAAGIYIPEVVLFEGFGRRDTFGPIDLSLPDIPLLAKGGIVNSPTLAMIGEAGREAVIPLDRMGGMGDTYNINVNVAPGGDLVATGKAIVDAIRQYERRSGRVWRSA